MKYFARIIIMPHPELLDPQGKAALESLKHLDITGVTEVRMGRTVEMYLDAADEDEARTKVEVACQKLFANQIVESYHYEVGQVFS